MDLDQVPLRDPRGSAKYWIFLLFAGISNEINQECLKVVVYQDMSAINLFLFLSKRVPRTKQDGY